jgi:hypothetical protein
MDINGYNMHKLSKVGIWSWPSQGTVSVYAADRSVAQPRSLGEGCGYITMGYSSRGSYRIQSTFDYPTEVIRMC